MYDSTQTDDFKNKMKDFTNAIQKKFQLDWFKTKWEDLNVPLNSGLGARLYIQVGYCHSLASR